MGEQQITSSELQFLRFTEWLCDVVLNASWAELGRMRADHLQPVFMFACHLHRNASVFCFEPTFVGKVATLMDDMHWMERHILRQLGLGEDANESSVINESVYALTHATPRQKVPRGTIFKFEYALFVVCKLYWNDFWCGHY